MKKMKKNIINALYYIEQNPNESLTSVGNKFKVDRHTLSDKIKENQFKKYIYESHKIGDEDFLYYFTEEELDIVDFYKKNSDKAYRIVKEKFPNAPDIRAMRNWMNILGNNYHKGALRKYHYNESKFKEIATEEDAYWLGFITADGCIVENKWLQIKLAGKDKRHLKKFCKYLELPDSEIEEIIKDEFGGAYTKDNPVNTIKICSKEIINNLIEKGVEPRKSGKEKPYICNTVNLQKAYIRGLIDGDGWIRETQFGFGIVGSYEICDYVLNFITNNIYDISNNSVREHGIIYKLEVNGKNQTSIILKELYEKASIYLDRKYILYQNIYKINYIAVDKSRKKSGRL